MDGLFMVSSDLWSDIDSKLGETFMMIPEKVFAALSVLIVADFQLPPVRLKLIFSQFSKGHSMKHFSGLQLWNLFKYTEIMAVVIQDDIMFVDLLNRVRVGIIDDDVENFLKTRNIC